MAFVRNAVTMLIQVYMEVSIERYVPSSPVFHTLMM